MTPDQLDDLGIAADYHEACIAGCERRTAQVHATPSAWPDPQAEIAANSSTRALHERCAAAIRAALSELKSPVL